MDPVVRLLLLEDDAFSAEMIQHVLRNDGLRFTALRVDDREAYVQALAEFRPDVILSDNSLPAFDGRSALEIALNQHPELPLIIVSGAFGDGDAARLIGCGAAACILKHELDRLGPAVRRALAAAPAPRGQASRGTSVGIDHGPG